MTNQILKICFFLGLVALVPLIGQANCGTAEKHKYDLVILGNVVGFDGIWSYLNLDCAPKKQTLVVQVKSCLKGKVTSKFVKVTYQYMGKEQELPEGIWNSENLWQFKLVKAKPEFTIKIIRNPSEQKEPSFSEEALKDPKDWQFKVVWPKRHQPCNGTIKMLQKTTGAETEEIPTTHLPCYELKPGDFQPFVQ